jgi:hypothetical protein
VQRRECERVCPELIHAIWIGARREERRYERDRAPPEEGSQRATVREVY